MDWEEFRKDRRRALLSLDHEEILAYYRKYAPKPDYDIPDEETFWAGVHIARTMLRDIPWSEEEYSKKWLEKNGWRFVDWRWRKGEV